VNYHYLAEAALHAVYFHIARNVFITVYFRLKQSHLFGFDVLCLSFCSFNLCDYFVQSCTLVFRWLRHKFRLQSINRKYCVVLLRMQDGLTPLHCAARSGHDPVVDMLLERGAPVASKTRNGLTSLHMAAQGDHVDSARVLIFHRAPIDEVTVVCSAVLISVCSVCVSILYIWYRSSGLIPI